jgi:PAS domain S-box-containing protein
VSREKSGEGKSVLQIARKVAATIGADFFRAIAKSLAEALAADCVLIAEFLGGQSERCRTLAAWLDGEEAHFEFELVESATSQLLLGKPCLWRNDVQSRFPNDKLLSQVEAEACVSVPLVDENEVPIGALMALYRRPVTSLRVPKAMLDIFADRASAELNRKRKEEKVRESEERYRAFIARNADAMWRVEFEQPVDTSLPELDQLAAIYKYGYLAECNDALARFVGLDRAEQLIGSRVEEIVPIADPSMREATLAAIRAGYQLISVETNPLIQGERRHLLRSQWGIVQDGKLERIWGSNRDITDLRHSQSALDASEQRMVDLLETMRLLVVMLDADGRVVFCNRHVYELTGWEPKKLVGKDWVEVMFPPEDRAKALAEFSRSADDPESSSHFEGALLTANRRRLQVAWDSTILLSAAGDVAARANIGRDITGYKALEEQLRQAQKLSGLGRLAGGLAHDFNNLLTVILGYTTELLSRHEPSDPALASLLEIRNAAEKGADLTSRLLAFSRRQVLHPEVLDLNAIVEDSRGMLRRLIGDNIKIATVLEPRVGPVRIDGGSFHQVLVNLAVNARDVMPDGGTLTITTASVSHPPAVLPPGDYVLLTVSDTGTGMTDEVCEHLFEPFFTTKEPGKGTGLGLSTVYGIVQQSGGHITVDTEAGCGTTFRIYLPSVQMKVADRAVANDHQVLPGGPETILVVEDRDDVRRLTVRLLADLGYNILEADGAASALDLVGAHAGAINLMVSDVVMPGMASDDLADRVRGRRPGIKVLFVSGGGSDFSPPARISEPGFAYLPKPFSLSDLAVRVRSLLDNGLPS